MPATEVFVPAVIHAVRTIDPGEIRVVALRLAEEYELSGRRYRLHDVMRPGNAFLTRPLGARTGKVRRRMYTRSNCALTEPRILETIINHTHEERADTSIWWQTEQVEVLHREGGTIDVRVDVDAERGELIVLENSPVVDAKNLRLEPDDQWPTMRMVAIGLSTGVTPFLAYVRYMAAKDFGRTATHRGAHLTLIVSVRSPRQLMMHDELTEFERAWPHNFRYVPVLTRAWPDDWPYGRGRLVRQLDAPEGDVRVDLQPLLQIVPDLGGTHLRMCGNALCRRELELGLQQAGIQVQSFRSEIW